MADAPGISREKTEDNSGLYSAIFGIGGALLGAGLTVASLGAGTGAAIAGESAILGSEAAGAGAAAGTAGEIGAEAAGIGAAEAGTEVTGATVGEEAASAAIPAVAEDTGLSQMGQAANLTQISNPVGVGVPDVISGAGSNVSGIGAGESGGGSTIINEVSTAPQSESTALKTAAKTGLNTFNASQNAMKTMGNEQAQTKSAVQQMQNGLGQQSPMQPLSSVNLYDTVFGARPIMQKKPQMMQPIYGINNGKL